MTNPTFEFRSDLFAATALAASTEQVRSYLGGVYVMPHRAGVLMVGTDGHRLALAYDESGSIDAPATLKTDFKAKELRRTARDAGQRRLACDGGPLASIVTRAHDKAGLGDITATLGALPLAVIREQYLDFTRVLPLEDPEKATMTRGVFWNLEYLATPVQAAKICGVASPRHLVAFSGSVDNGPTWATHPGVPEMVFVIMPARGYVETHRPDWLQFSPMVQEDAE